MFFNFVSKLAIPQCISFLIVQQLDTSLKYLLHKSLKINIFCYLFYLSYMRSIYEKILKLISKISHTLLAHPGI